MENFLQGALALLSAKCMIIISHKNAVSFGKEKINVELSLKNNMRLYYHFVD